MKEFVIGRQGDQWFKIDNQTHDTVHNRHAKITIRDDGSWWLEDLKGASSNGTFIRELGSEEWKPVLNQRITPTTMIRLSSYHSYTFMAHRVIQEPESYSYELKAMLKLWRAYGKKIEAEEKNISRRKKVVSALMVGGLATGLGVSFIPSVLAQLGVAGNFGGAAIGGIAPFFLYGRMFLSPNMTKLTELKVKRQKAVTCPKCGRPMSEADVNNMICSICKCK